MIYPYYKDKMSVHQFNEVIREAMNIMAFYVVYADGEAVGAFECRFKKPKDEVFVDWFTEDPLKKALSFQHFRDFKKPFTIKVEKKDSGSYFALQRKHLMKFLGKENDEFIFEAA